MWSPYFRCATRPHMLHKRGVKPPLVRPGPPLDIRSSPNSGRIEHSETAGAPRCCSCGDEQQVCRCVLFFRCLKLFCSDILPCFMCTLDRLCLSMQAVIMEILYMVILWTLWLYHAESFQPQPRDPTRQYSQEFLMQWDNPNRVDMHMDLLSFKI